MAASEILIGVEQLLQAPGWPGIAASWTSSAKTGVGCALPGTSRVWFAISHGIVNEIYYPRLDHACTRDFGLILSSDRGDMWEEKRDANPETRHISPGVPGFALTSTFPKGHVIEKRILAASDRDALLQRVKLTAPGGDLKGLHLTVILAPHLVNKGADNTAWLDDYKGMPMLFAGGSDVYLALACDLPFKARSVGFVGVSDGWQDVRQNGRLTWEYPRAESGNVALSAELDLSASVDFTVAVGFGAGWAEAAHEARASLLAGFAHAERQYIAGWQTWSSSLLDLHDEFAAESATVLRVHESQSFPGGIIASLSIPWGFAKGDDDLGGYHLVWPRDLVETMGGLIATGALVDATRVIEYLRTTQESDGSWPQNMWLDGTAYWGGIQMDETAFPILAVDAAVRHGCPLIEADYWPMIRSAAGFLVRNGPITGQDRWEEDGGYSPFTLAVEVSALIVAADHADRAGQPAVGKFLRETADAWNAAIERWTYVTGTPVADEVGVDGYYVRIAPPESGEAVGPADRWVSIKNRPSASSQARVEEIVSPDALALVRFGLRSATDPRIVNTVKVIDHLLKVELPQGPGWYRYNGDGYGEHENGDPFDGTGVGRPWPLLTGERAHYELAAGNVAEAERLAGVFRASAGPTHLLPEQVWDGQAIPEKELVFGHATGSARPLAWAHAEYIKLRRSLADGQIFDRPPQAHERYVAERNQPVRMIWSSGLRCRTVATGLVFRIHTQLPCAVVWTTDAWATTHETRTEDTTLGIYTADIDSSDLPTGSKVEFTFRYDDDTWDDKNYEVQVTEGTGPGDRAMIARQQ